MTNPFISIWIIIRTLFVKVDAKLWQIFALGAGLLYLVYLLCCIHQINEYEESYQLTEIGGKVENGSSSILVNVNHGLLSGHEQKGGVDISINGVVDTINTKRYAEQRGDLIQSAHMANGHNFAFEHIRVDSLLSSTLPDSIYYNLTNMYTLTATASCHSRNRQSGPTTPETPYTFENDELFYNIGRQLKQERLHPFDYLAAVQYAIATGYAHSHDEIQLSGIWRMPVLHDFPRIFSPWDISQKRYKFQYTTWPIEGKRNELMPLERLEFDFQGPVELSAMYPEPDIVTFSGMVFTDPAKLRQIMDDGLAYYAKFPQLESLQSIRIFFLTTFISLFFTLLCTVTYRIIRNKVQKIVRKKRSLNKQTE